MASIGGEAQQDRFVGGSQLVATALAERLGDAVHLEAPVNRVVQRNGYVLVEAGTVTVKAERAVIALPPTLAGRITYDPPLPSHRDQLMQRLPQGTVTKVNVVYDVPFWIPDLQAELLGAVVSRDTVWMEWRMKGMRANREPFEFAGVNIFGVRENRIIGGRIYTELVRDAGGH